MQVVISRKTLEGFICLFPETTFHLNLLLLCAERGQCSDGSYSRVLALGLSCASSGNPSRGPDQQLILAPGSPGWGYSVFLEQQRGWCLPEGQSWSWAGTGLVFPAEGTWGWFLHSSCRAPQELSKTFWAPLVCGYRLYQVILVCATVVDFQQLLNLVLLGWSPLKQT